MEQEPREKQGSHFEFRITNSLHSRRPGAHPCAGADFQPRLAVWNFREQSVDTPVALKVQKFSALAVPRSTFGVPSSGLSNSEPGTRNPELLNAHAIDAV